jgi:excisionase family DNA binding protein
MATLDYSTWLTKQQAADTIGVSTKTVESLAKDRKIEQAAWRPQGRGAERAVYNPDDVARIAADRTPGRPAFVLPAVSTPTNGNRDQAGHHTQLATASRGAAGPEAAAAYLQAMLTAILGASSQTSESSQKSETTFLTVAEASAVTGLTQAYLLRAIAAQTLPAVKDRGWRIRRRDLEQL